MRIASAWRILIGIVLLLIAMAAGTSVSTHFTPQVAPPLGIAFGFLLLAASVIVHEAGHAIAAWAIGWRVHVISAFSLGYLPAHRKFHRVERSGSSDFAGFVFSSPPAPDGWRKGSAIVVLGGPLANIVVGLCAIGIADSWARFSIWGMGDMVAVGALGLVSLTLGVGNFLPFWGHGQSASDGARLLSIFFGGSLAGERPVGNWLAGQIADGKSNWPSSLQERFEREPPGDAAVDTYIRASFLLRGGDLGGLVRLLDGSQLMQEGRLLELTADYAFAVALTERDAARASAILARVPESMRSAFNYARAQIVLAALNGDYAAAGALVASMRKTAAAIGARPDQDDEALFAAVERREPLPARFERQAA